MPATLTLLKKYWPVLLGAAIVLVVALAFLAGYRIGAGFSLVRNGTLVMQGLPKDAAVFVDSLREAKSKNGTARLTLTPGTHSLIVEAPGMLPWSELFEVRESETTMLDPILVPLSVEARTLEGEEKRQADHAIWNEKFPTSRAPLMVASGCAAVRVNGSSVIVEPATGEGCEPPSYLCEADACTPVIAYEAPDQVQSVLRYPGREDALVVATGGLLFIVELDPREPQFIGELWRGALAFAALWSETSVVVSDGTRTYEVPLP